MAVRYGGDRIVLQAAHELVENTESAIEEAGSETGIPGALLRGVVKVETGVSPYAVSRSNARGNAQLTKIARNEVARRFNYRPNDIYDLKQNAKVAGWYLRLLLTRHVPARKGFSPKNRASNIRAALAMYRLGPNDPRIRGPEKTWPAGVRKYVDRAYGLYATHPASHKHAWLAKLQVAEK